MDLVFHPVVFYFSGYDPKDDQSGQLHSRLSALEHYETIIDRHFNKRIFLENIVKPAIVNEFDNSIDSKYLPTRYYGLPEKTDLLFPVNPQPPLLL